MDHKKKILYLLTQTHYGGAQKYVHDLARGLDKERYEVIVGVGEGTQEPWLTDLVDAGIDVMRLKHVKRNLNLWHDIMSSFELYKLYKLVQPNVIHINSSKIGATGSVVAKIFNITSYGLRVTDYSKVIYTVHGLVLNEPLALWRKLYYWIAEFIGAQFKNTLICVSEIDKRAILKWHITKAQKIKVIHNGIDLDNLIFLSKEDAREKLSQLTTYNLQLTIVIGTIAGLYKTKGLQYLIKAINLLVTRYSLRIACLIIGSGPEENSLRNLIKKHKLEDKISIINISENAAIYLNAFDIFVLPSVKEGLSYTLIEARAAGLPILTTRVGGNPEIIENNKTGILIPAADIDMLAKELANLSQYKNVREKLSLDTKNNISDFSLQEMIRLTIQQY